MTCLLDSSPSHDEEDDFRRTTVIVLFLLRFCVDSLSSSALGEGPPPPPPSSPSPSISVFSRRQPVPPYSYSSSSSHAPRPVERNMVGMRPGWTFLFCQSPSSSIFISPSPLDAARPYSFLSHRLLVASITAREEEESSFIHCFFPSSFQLAYCFCFEISLGDASFGYYGMCVSLDGFCCPVSTLFKKFLQEVCRAKSINKIFS